MRTSMGSEWSTGSTVVSYPTKSDTPQGAQLGTAEALRAPQSRSPVLISQQSEGLSSPMLVPDQSNVNETDHWREQQSL